MSVWRRCSACDHQERNRGINFDLASDVADVPPVDQLRLLAWDATGRCYEAQPSDYFNLIAGMELAELTEGMPDDWRGQLYRACVTDREDLIWAGVWPDVLRTWWHCHPGLLTTAYLQGVTEGVLTSDQLAALRSQYDLDRQIADATGEVMSRMNWDLARADDSDWMAAHGW